MLKAPKYAAPLFAFAILCPLAAVSAVSVAANTIRLAESGRGTQIAATIVGNKATPRRQPTHSIGAVINPHLLTLRGPALRESGMGRLVGGDTVGLRTTPRRAPTLSVQPVG